MRPLMVLLLVACHGSKQTTHPSYDRNRITTEEIRAAHAQDLYQLVQERRPAWLVPRGVTSVRNPPAIMVYVEGVPAAGGVARLRDYQAREALELRFLSATEATQKYGTNNSAGAIEVSLRHGK